MNKLAQKSVKIREWFDLTPEEVAEATAIVTALLAIKRMNAPDGLGASSIVAAIREKLSGNPRDYAFFVAGNLMVDPQTIDNLVDHVRGVFGKDPTYEELYEHTVNGLNETEKV